MIASHGYPQNNQTYTNNEANSESVSDLKNKDIGSGSLNSNVTGGDPFSPNFSEEDFDIGSVQIPQAALEDQAQQNIPQHHHQHHHQNPYYMHQQQHHPMHQGQHHMYHQQQQMHWHQQHQYMNGAYHYGDHYGGYGGYGLYQQQPNQMNQVMPGGPSPVGSHASPSPQPHSEDGDHSLEQLQSIRSNNNSLKRAHSPDSVSQHQQAYHSHPGYGNGPVTGHQQPGSMMGHHMQHQHSSIHPHHHSTPHQQPSPLSHQEMHHSHHHPQHTSPHALMPAKKPKVSKRKKKRDPNEPQKPVSAYALFFRDSQASIKAANPNAAFGDVSKIVASMWDSLDPENKAAYKKRTENAKKEYLKKLAAYRASLVSKGSGDITAAYPYGYGAYAELAAVHQQNGGPNTVKPSGAYIHSASGTGAAANYMQPLPPRPPMQHQHGYMIQPHQQQPMMGQPASHRLHPQQSSLESGGPSQHSPLSHIGSNQDVSNKQETNSSSGPITSTSTTVVSASNRPQRCGRPGCSNVVPREASGWNNTEFCSNECVVGQCNEVYRSWSSNNASASSQQQPQQTCTAQVK